jgi:hypothetical protein
MLTVTLNCRNPRHLNQIVEEAEYGIGGDEFLKKAVELLLDLL